MLNLFRRQPKQRTPSGPAGARAYGIGDVHGRLDLMEALIERIRRDDEARGPARTFLVFLGDLVDRGPDSRGVVDRLATRPPRFARNIFLSGNHEEAFLRVIGGDASVVPAWLLYGGKECAQSYGIGGGWLLNAAPQSVAHEVARLVPRAHVDFLSSFGDTFRFGDYLFVHAGIRPGVAVEDQDPKDLRWIREGFLEDRTDHGCVVVHGHTIVEAVEEHPNRIAIDTGAYRSGVLTAIGLEGTERWFIDAKAD